MSDNRSIGIFDIERMKLTTYNNLVLKDFTNVAITPDNNYAVFGFRDGTIKLWDLSTDSEVYSIPAHKEAVNTIAISLDRRLIVSGGEDNTAKVWNLDIGTGVLTISHSEPVNLVSITLDQIYVISLSGYHIKA